MQDAEAIAQLNTVVQDIHHRHLPGRFKAPDPKAFLPVVQEWLRSGSRAAFLAETDDGELIGYALAVVQQRPENPLTFGATVVELDQLAVAPAHRRYGVGTALVRRVMEYARQQAADRVDLGVHQFNQEAQAFFATVGFRVSLLRMAVNIGQQDVDDSVLHTVERVVFFVDDVERAVTWYQEVLGGTVDRSGLPTVVAGHVHLAFHPADAKTPAGIGGVVPYCGVQSLDAVVQRFLDGGASIYRGPLTIEDGRRTCQVRDPFGNVLGLVGP